MEPIYKRGRPSIVLARRPTYWANEAAATAKKNEKPRKEIENPDRNFRTNGRTIVPSSPQRSAVIKISAAYWLNI